jgi:hydroxymethylbilane synthase
MSPRPPIRIGTRGSALALRQTEWVREKLRLAGHETEPIEIRTTGDIVQDVPLSQIGARAIFTRQIDDAMLDGRIDLAVHSLKDLPTVLPDGIVLAAVAEREDPSDALVGRGEVAWDTLPHGGIVGTSSLRRRAQLLHVRADLRVIDLRGNVGTRLTRLDENEEWSAVILATAGLSRLGLSARIGQRLPPEVMLPAPGQGALAITARDDDSASGEAARVVLHHLPTALAVLAERAFLRELEGGCQVPVAALATVHEATVRLHGRVVALLGERAVEGIEMGSARSEPEAEAIGVALAERLVEDGAGDILAAVRSQSAPAVPEP